MFIGRGKNGFEREALCNDNFDWTITDRYVNFLTSHGVKASIEFQPLKGTNISVSTPEKLGDVGFIIIDRYTNAAQESGFHDALELFDFCPESDITNSPTINEEYEKSFAFFEGFARRGATSKLNRRGRRLGE